MTDRGSFADPEKKSLLSAAKSVTDLTPALGTEIIGLDLRQLSSSQKDELYVKAHIVSFNYSQLHSALLIAERGVVCKT